MNYLSMTLFPRPAAKFPMAALVFLAPFLLLLAISARGHCPGR